jgi:hypothetical protein
MQRLPRGLHAFGVERERCLVIAEGLHEVVLGPRVALDLLVTVDDELLVFLRLDDEIVVELVTLGSA